MSMAKRGGCGASFASAIVSAVLALTAEAVRGQDEAAATPRAIEEIVVTAQKTEQKLQDVPISMTVLGGDFLEQQGVSDFDDLAVYVPNTRIDAGAAFPDVRVRGFGSPLSNKGFEQSVGLQLDGVPYGRLIYFQMPLYDVERVEVLRGPQGTLVGKNTTAGVFSIVNRKPTDELEGRISLEYGELDRRRIDGAVSGPVIPGFLNLRLAGVDETRDGYLRNTSVAVTPRAETPLGGRARQGIRGQLGFPDIFGSSWNLSYEHATSDLDATWGFRQVHPYFVNYFRSRDPNADFDGENLVSSVDQGGYNRREFHRWGLTGNYPFASGWNLDFVGEFSKMKIRVANDNDFTPADIFRVRSTDDNRQKTAELRASSPQLDGLLGLGRLFGLELGTSNFTGGFFFQRREMLDSALAIYLDITEVAGLVASGGTADPVPPIPGIPPALIQVLQQLDDIEETTGFFEQHSDSWAGFGHLTWNLYGPWTIEHGMRFSWEKKTGSVENAFTRGTGVAYIALLMAEEFQSDLSLDEFAFTPKEVLRYDWSDDVGFFFSWARGFKAGGFNELSVNNDNNLTFDREATTSWELGAKTRLFDGVATANVTLFWQDVTNLQVFVVDPDAALVSVRNAGEARSRGVELDASWLATDWLTLIGTAGFLEAKYLDFPFGTCAADRPDTDGSGDGFCDLSGEQATHTPKWMGTLTSNARYPLDSLAPKTWTLPGFLSGVDLTGGFTIEYNDVQFGDQSNDFRMRQPSYVKLRASLGFADDERGWAIGVTGENLTDEVTVSQTRDVPLAGGNIVQVQEAPRLVFGTLSFRF